MKSIGVEMSKDTKLLTFKRFIEAQKHRIEFEKWIEGERQNRDPGDEYILDWILKNAPDFRKQWEESDCSECIKWRECGYLVKKECDEFDY